MLHLASSCSNSMDKLQICTKRHFLGYVNRNYCPACSLLAQRMQTVQMLACGLTLTFHEATSAGHLPPALADPTFAFEA